MNFSDFLESVDSFKEFNVHELAMLEQALIVDDYPPRHVFFREGEAADSMYLVVDGEVLASRRRPEGRGHVELHRLHSGELFGLVSLIDHGPHIITCTGIDKTAVASLPRAAFELLYKANANVGYHFQQLIARQLVQDLRLYSRALAENLPSKDSDAPVT